MATTDIKKFLDQSGVSTLWSKVADKVATEKARAEAEEAKNAAAAKKAQDEVDALEQYVGTIPVDYTESNIVAFIQKRAAEVLAAAQGGSSETAASVKTALNNYIALNDPKVSKNSEDIDAIIKDYLTSADKNELVGDIAENAAEILRIDAALKAAIENDGAGLDSIKELAAWIEEHGEDAAGYAAAISALETLVGDKAVATQIENAIAAEQLEQYAKTAEIEGTLNKVDIQGTVTAAISAAIDALKIGDYAKAADLTALATRVATLENAGYQNSTQVSTAIENAITALKAEDLWDAKGAAAAAKAHAESYANGLAKNYATAAQGEKADSALQAADIATGTVNGSISVKGTNIAVHGLGTAAYTNVDAYDVKGAAGTAESNAKSYADDLFANVQALSESEILAVIASNTNT